MPALAFYPQISQSAGITFHHPLPLSKEGGKGGWIEIFTKELVLSLPKERGQGGID